jgi:hypothetical protein
MPITTRTVSTTPKVSFSPILLLSIDHPETLASLPIGAYFSVFSLVAKDIGPNRQTAPKNSTKAGTRDLSFQKYLHR